MPFPDFEEILTRLLTIYSSLACLHSRVLAEETQENDSETQYDGIVMESDPTTDSVVGLISTPERARR